MLPDMFSCNYESFLAKSKSKSDPDTLTFWDAMKEPDAADFRDAMSVEIAAPEAIGVWSVVPRNEALTKVVPGTWTFKRKRFPDGRVKKHKARFCVRGDLQEDCGDTFAPVVRWSTVRVVLYFALILGLPTRAVDYDSAFAQADLPPDKPLWIEFPMGFHSAEGDHHSHILRLHKSLYGTKFAPVLWNAKLTNGLLARGYHQSAYDPCLFIKGSILIVVFVDDCVFCSPDAATNEKEINSLRSDFDLTDEGDLSSFLGVSISRDESTTPPTFSFTQTGLIDRVLAATHMEDCKPNATPAAELPLGADLSGPTFAEDWQYSSVVGMLLFLANNSHPDIAYATHQCARFTHNTKQMVNRNLWLD